MPGTKEAMAIFRNKLKKMNADQMAIMLRQLSQEKRRRTGTKKKKMTSKK